MLISALCLAATPALAEVCDKEHPIWAPAGGPVGQVGEAIRIFSGPFGLTMLALFTTALVVPGRWLPVVLAALFAALAGLVLGAAWDFDTVALAAFREGCRADPWLASALVGLMALALVARLWRGQRIRRKKRSVTSPPA